MEGILFPGDRTAVLSGLADPNSVPDGFVVVVVQGSGICGTDLHRYRLSKEERRKGGEFVTGHEAVGFVADADLRPTRRRVAVHQAWGCTLADGPCPEATDPRSKRCSHTAVMGLNTHGANATYQVVPEDRLMDLPEALDWDDAVLLACNYGTAWAAVRSLELSPDELVLVAGLGPVGLLAAVIAKERGSSVVGLDKSPYRLDFARALGFEVITEFPPDGSHRGYDAIVETTGAVEVNQRIIAQLAPRGRGCLVGIGPATKAGSLRELIFKEARLAGSLIFDKEDWPAIVDDYMAMRSRARRVISHRVTPDDVPDIYQLADAGRTAKVVFDWSNR